MKLGLNLQKKNKEKWGNLNCSLPKILFICQAVIGPFQEDSGGKLGAKFSDF